MKRFYVVRLNGKKYMFKDQQQAEAFAKEHKRKVFYWGECNTTMCGSDFVFVD